MKKATSLQGSFPLGSESNHIKKIDMNKRTPLNAQQGLETLQLSATMTVNHGFFTPLFQLFIGRGGASSIQDPLWGRLARRLLLAVSNTPIALESNHLEKTKGEHSHA